MKSLSGAQTTALKADNLPVIAFAKFDFPTALSRYCTAKFDYTWDDGTGSATWKGLGGLVTLESFRETGDVEAVGLRASLVGFPTSAFPNPISLALNENVQGRTAQIWIGFLDANYQLIGTPVLEFQGRIDTLDIIEDGNNATMAVNMESRFASILRPNVRRFTDRDQQLAYPGDKYFEFLPQMREKVIIFPTAEAQRR